MSRFETILYEVTPDKVGTITLNRPDRLTAFSRRTSEEFRALWAEIAEDEGVNAVVLRASQESRAFSTGMDVFAGDRHLGSDQLWNKRDPGELLGPKFNHCWKPLVIAVHGMCAGGAFYWLNEGDVVLCSDDATFFDPHVTYGMTAALEPIGLRWRIPLGEVLRMALMGNDERVSAATALRIGLVTEVTTHDALWDRAHAIAATIAAKPSIATQGTVRAIWESLDQTRTASLTTALKYTLLSNPTGTSQVSREEIMGNAKKFTVR